MANGTETQVEKVREIVNVSSFAEVKARVDSLNASAWADTVEDIAEWEKVKNKHTKIKGDGVEIDKSDNRLAIRNRVRVRLGYPEVDEHGQTKESTVFFSPSCTVSKNVTW